MAFMDTANITLFTEIYLKQELISQVYSYVGHRTSSEGLIKTTDKKSPGNKFFSFSYVPEYMETIVSEPALWTEKVFPSVKGYAIELDDFTDVDDYLKKHLKKRRENIKRAAKRLETCFDITYKMFQNDIREDEYLFLMGEMKGLIVKRFQQKGKKSENIANWDKILSTSLELIKKGKASIFAIYNNNHPIAISFNYNFPSLLFGYISSYDIAYSKFSLGQLLIYKQLQWCIENNYSQFDMGWGDMEYKRWWSNKIYRFNHRIIYPKHSFPGFLYAFWKGNTSRVLAFLISKGVNDHWNKFKLKLKGDTKILMRTPTYRLEDMSISEMDALKETYLNQRNQLPVTDQMINDFLFLTKEHSKNVTLHYLKSKNLYVLKGKNKTKAILINPEND
ncbi:GNAT family N-acetyltransferase [Flagellimonas flava]|uniref:Acetyltransferase (GNAT) domain-containing protein n=1 Tax=Flagellimonas flava TaxID=570519 RepID=A0A1M5J8J5_9FLAO|nr:GNAT family N-acetyltransferase [Allomuricauda flava]SHG36619.1 Acetyltransferase (GNAT) domain-containing protein [Allomuricauda flava]